MPVLTRGALKASAPQANGQCIACLNTGRPNRTTILGCCGQMCLDSLPELCKRVECGKSIDFFWTRRHASPLWHCSEECMQADVASGHATCQRWVYLPKVRVPSRA